MALKNRIGDLVNVDDDVPGEIQDMATRENAVVIAFVGSYAPRKINPARSQSSSISLAEEFGMEEALLKICKKCDNRKLYFLVNSTGGR